MGNTAATNFSKKLYCSLIILTILNFIAVCILKIIIIPLSENQILYIFSSLAQVEGALLGLTIAAYSLVDSKLQTKAISDNTIYEYVEEVRKDNYFCLFNIIFFSIVTILLCIIVLSIYDNYLNIFLSFCMNEVLITFILVILFLIKFVKCLNPSETKERSSEDKRFIDNQNISSENNEVSFSEFIYQYNNFENLIRKFANNYNEHMSHSNNRSSFIEALNILINENILNKEMYSNISEIRRYRNALVHGLDSDKEVNYKLYKELVGLYKQMNVLYENIEENEFKDILTKTLQEYSDYGYSDIDKEIIDFLQDKSYVTIKELAEHLNCSVRSTHYRVKNLVDIGVLKMVRKGKTTLVGVASK